MLAELSAPTSAITTKKKEKKEHCQILACRLKKSFCCATLLTNDTLLQMTKVMLNCIGDIFM